MHKALSNVVKFDTEWTEVSSVVTRRIFVIDSLLLLVLLADQLQACKYECVYVHLCVFVGLLTCVL